MCDKVAFLDRDGVINESVAAHDYVRNWEMFRFKIGSIDGIRRLNQDGYKVVVVTNQRGIARKLMTVSQLNQIHAKMIETVSMSGGRIDAVYYCPHDIGECRCRKPDIGLFLEAERTFRVNKGRSFMIGDSVSDIEAGKRFGIASYLLEQSDTLDNLVSNILS